MTTNPTKITSFSGHYAFLSNFYVEEDGLTNEHRFQAAKTTDIEEIKWILRARKPKEAKKRGRQVTLREDWEEVKVEIMEDLLREKFRDRDLAMALLDTDPLELVEGNWWGDTEWGVYRGQGKNLLGKALMKIREEIKDRETRRAR